MSKKNKTPEFPAEILSDLHLYLRGAVEIYGIIPTEKMAEIINSQNSYKVTPDDIKRACGILKREKYAFFGCYKNCVTHEVFLEGYEEDEEEFEELRRKQQGKPYREFGKDEFLKHTDAYYVPPIPDIYKKLRKYIVSELDVDRITAEIICEDIYTGVNFLDDEDDINFEFRRRDIFPTVEQYERIGELIRECRYHTSRWEHRGYSQAELDKINKTAEAEVDNGQA